MSDLAVIMSIYKNDSLGFVKQSIQSILDQTFSGFHYYLIFDGPVATDVNAYVTSLTDERIRFFRLENNNGLANALNYLLEKVMNNPEYKFIARMDADDISMQNRFKKQRTYLIENPEITVLGCWYEDIDESGKHLSFRRLPTDHESLRKRYFIKTPFAHPSVMYRRELIEKAGNYPTDTVLMEDNVLWGRALLAGLRFANIPEYLLKFRIDKNFVKRRSGFKYGWSYVVSRFKINRRLNAPYYTFLPALAFGFCKMMPTFILKYIYTVAQRH
jgi:glycosyltransferase involved in cell wall biosynthesis